MSSNTDASNERFDHISVLTFNILAPCYVRVTNQPWNAFEHVSDADLDHDARKAKTLAYLQASQAHAICLQEVELDLNDSTNTWEIPAWLSPLLKTGGYTGVTQLRSDESVVRIVEKNTEMFGRQMLVSMVVLFKTELYDQVGPAIPNSNSVGVVLKRREAPEHMFGIACVHLIGDPEAQKHRIQQLRSTVLKLSDASDQPVHLIIAGDFNTELDGPVSELLHSAGHQAEATIARNHKLVDMSGGPTWSTPERSLRLDHIVFSSTSLACKSHSAVLNEEDCLTGLPNVRWPSDHCAVGGLFEVVREAYTEPVHAPVSKQQRKEMVMWLHAWHKEAPSVVCTKIKPSLETIKLLKIHKLQLKEWMAEMTPPEAKYARDAVKSVGSEYR